MKFTVLLSLLFSANLFAQVQKDSIVIRSSAEYPPLTKKKITYNNGVTVKIECMDSLDAVQKTLYYDEDGKDRYDYPVLENYTLSECIEIYTPYLTDFELKKGDVIADVGAGYGFFDGILSVLCDSMTLYLEDIDPDYLNQEDFNKMVNYFSALRPTPQTNTFHFKIGTKKATLLPDTTFDKIIMMNTFHEISYPDEMIGDILKKLKPGGILIIDDSFSKKDKIRKAAGCYKKAYKVSKVIEIMKKHRLFMTKMVNPENSFSNILIFERDSIKSDRYFNKRSSIEEYIQITETLDNRSTADNSWEVQSIGDTLAAHLDSITRVYKNFEYFISETANDHMDVGNYHPAINICKLNVKLFPLSADAHYDLGDSYYLLGKDALEGEPFEKALMSYKKSAELDSTIAHGKENINEVENILSDIDQARDPYNHYTSSFDTSEYVPEYHWPYLGPDVPPYFGLSVGYEGFKNQNLMAGLVINFFNVTSDAGGMGGAIFSYKRNLQNANIYSFEAEIGIYSPITFGFCYTNNHTENTSLGSFKPFIGISLFNLQLFYGYSFYKGTKDTDQQIFHNRFTFRYVIPITKLFRSP